MCWFSPIKMLMSTFVNLARVNTLIEPSMLCIAESLMFLPGELAILCCWALTAIAAQSKAVSQRVAKRLLFALTNCSEKDKLLVCMLLLDCTLIHMHYEVVSVSVLAVAPT